MARTSQQQGRVERRQRKRGPVYVLRYRLREGDHWIQKTEELREEKGGPCKTPKAAQKAAAERMREINRLNDPNATVESRNPGLRTMVEFVKGPWWQDHLTKKVKVSTAYNYDSLLKTYVLPFIGEKPLQGITPSDIAEVLKRREVAGSTPMSMRNLYGLLNVMFDIAVGYDLVEVSPVRKRLHRPEVEATEKPTLTAEQIRRVIDETAEEHRPMLLMVALTALRVGELLGLRWENIDFEGRRLAVAHTLWQGQLLKPKTKRSQRQIHMPAALVDALRVHNLRSRFTAPDDFVFARDDGSPFGQQHVRDHVLSPALIRAGIQRVKGQHGFHLFRHSVASIVYQATKDLKLGQELLGHSTINTTGNIYTHTDGAAREATELLEREIVGNRGLTVAWATDRVQ